MAASGTPPPELLLVLVFVGSDPEPWVDEDLEPERVELVPKLAVLMGLGVASGFPKYHDVVNENCVEVYEGRGDLRPTDIATASL